MATHEFPTYAASAIQANGFGRDYTDSVERIMFDNGTTQMIDSHQEVEQVDTMSIWLTVAEFEAFKKWWRNDIKKVGKFNYNPPGLDDGVAYIGRLDSGIHNQRFIDHEANFVAFRIAVRWGQQTEFDQVTDINLTSAIIENFTFHNPVEL